MPVLRKNMIRRVVMSASISAISFGAAYAAPAESEAVQTAQATPNGNSSQIEEVVVTAEKRKQNVKDVPASISVLGGAQLEQQHISSYDDISRNTPGISFSAGGSNGVGVGSQSLEIRGVGSQVGAATVGLYVDEVPVTLLSTAGTFSPKPFDLARIEILRGPQGTLYGASSQGGTVRFITNQPVLDEYQADVTGDVSDTLHGGVNGDGRVVVNVPIIPGVLAVRAGVEYTDQSGWLNQYQHAPGILDQSTGVLLKDNINHEIDQVYKVSAKWQITDDFNVTPQIIYQREHEADSPSFFLDEGLYNQSKSVPEYSRDVDVIPSLTINKGVGFGTFTSVSSYFYREYNRNRDGTYYDPDVVVPYYLDTDPRTAAFAPIADKGLATTPTDSFDKERNTVITEELRLASKTQEETGLPFNWVSGFFFSNDTDKDNHDEPAPGWNSTFQSIYGYSPNDAALSPIADPTDPTLWSDRFFFDQVKRGVMQFAGFGQVNFDILPYWHASVGGRYQYSHLTYARNGGGWWDIGDIHNYSQASNNYAFTPKFTSTIDITKDANIYANIAKGFRIGGVNDPVPPGLCGPYEKQIGISSAPVSYSPDKLWNYELGSKGTYFDRTLSVNADVYFIQWDNVQQQILIPVCGFNYVSNVGAAQAYGSELEMQYRVPFVPGLSLGFNGSVEHATITSTSGNGAAAVGQKLLFTPDWTATFNAAYNFPIDEDNTGFVRFDYDWTGRSHGDFQRDQPDYSNKQYGVLNGSVGANLEDDLQVQLYAKNLANDRTLIKTPTVALITEGYTVMPLTIGVRFEKRFSAPASPEPIVATVAPPPPPPEAPTPAPAAAPAPEAQRVFQVFFDFDKSTLTSDAAGVIKAAAQAIKTAQNVRIVVTGHTDTVGSIRYNKALSERRAAIVKKELLAEGVSEQDITTVGAGKTGLLVPTPDEVREPQNRRAEIELK